MTDLSRSRSRLRRGERSRSRSRRRRRGDWERERERERRRRPLGEGLLPRQRMDRTFITTRTRSLRCGCIRIADMYVSRIYPPRKYIYTAYISAPRITCKVKLLRQLCTLRILFLMELIKCYSIIAMGINSEISKTRHVKTNFTICNVENRKKRAIYCISNTQYKVSLLYGPV